MANLYNFQNTINHCIYIFNVFLLPLVSADYCEFGFCKNEQYCCGDNKCCTKTLDLWFFWAGILLVIFALAVAAGVRYTRNQTATYVLLATHPMEEPQVTPVTFK